MALLATGREAGRDMVGRGRLLIRSRVAGIALERKSLKLSGGRALVAAVALQRGMSSNQGKPVLVISDGLYRNLPAFDRVAAFAVCTHLAAMNVGVAIGTPRAGVGKDWFHVALRTGHVFVQTKQRVGCFAVIKFRNSPYRFPSEHGVAVLAGDVQAAVRTARGRRNLGLRFRCGRRHAQQQPGESKDGKLLDLWPAGNLHNATSSAEW